MALTVCRLATKGAVVSQLSPVLPGFALADLHLADKDISRHRPLGPVQGYVLTAAAKA
jgi:hypothetical protein